MIELPLVILVVVPVVIAIVYVGKLFINTARIKKDRDDPGNRPW